MKTFGKVMLTLLWIFIAGCQAYNLKQALEEANRIWE